VKFNHFIRIHSLRLQVIANSKLFDKRIVRVLSFKAPCPPHYFAPKSPKPSKPLG
jgi:hypothetical protein